MAKKIETTVTLTDDLDGSKADRTVQFGISGTSYEIDLSKKNASALEKALAPYVAAGRKIAPSNQRRRRANSAASAAHRRSDHSAVRAWARTNGYEVSDRGRIPAALIEAYEAAR